MLVESDAGVNPMGWQCWELLGWAGGLVSPLHSPSDITGKLETSADSPAVWTPKVAS